MYQKLLFVIFSFVMSVPVFAQDGNTHESSGVKKQLQYALGLGYTSGGDKLATAIYTDGSTDSISAGSGLIFYGGLGYRLKDKVSIQGNLGYHFDNTKAASNGKLTFRRIPLEFLGYYHAHNAVRLGGGVRMVFGSRLKGSGIASGLNQKFSNTVGLVIEAEYIASSKFGIKARYVNEKYKPENSPISLDGSHFGVLTSFYF